MFCFVFFFISFHPPTPIALKVISHMTVNMDLLGGLRIL